MRRFLIMATAVLAGGLLTACGDNTGPESVRGLYGLNSINGKALPVDLGGIEYIAGQIILSTDGTYSRKSTVDSGGGPETTTDTGTFTVDGSTVQFDDLGTGTVSGNALTIVIDGDMFVFAKVTIVL